MIKTPLVKCMSKILEVCRSKLSDMLKINAMHCMLALFSLLPLPQLLRHSLYTSVLTSHAFHPWVSFLEIRLELEHMVLKIHAADHILFTFAPFANLVTPHSIGFI